MKNKKITFLFIAVLLIVSFCGVLTACNNKGDTNPVYLTVDGDISGNSVEINLNGISMSTFSFKDKNEADVTLKGWNVSAIMNKVSYLYAANRLMITGTDGTAAIIEIPFTDAVYLYADGDKLNAKAPEYPAVTGIKGISELTVIADDSPSNVPEPKLTSVAAPSISVVEADTSTDQNAGRATITRGNAKLLNYTSNPATYKGENNNSAVKCLKKESFTVADFSKKVLEKNENVEKTIAYFTDYDILPSVSDKQLFWSKGELKIEAAQGVAKGITGIVTGTDKLNYNAYKDMTEAIDEDIKVMFILLDGLSFQQVVHNASELSILKPENGVYNGKTKAFSIAASTNPAKSEVALASFLTGESPFVTTVTSKNNRELAVPDIFNYAVIKNKKPLYVEGNTDMLNTSMGLETKLNVHDANNDKKYTDYDGKVKLFNDYAVKKCALNNLVGKDAVVVHFHGIDDQNHSASPLSSASLTKIKEVEGYVKELIDAFDGKVIVASDHGHFTYYLDGDITKPYGNHATFTNLDMYVPYYVFG